MKAIVFSSNTGFTAEYARLLSQKSGLPVMSVSEATKTLDPSCEVIFMSWLMAGKISDYKKAKKRFDIKAVCAVGLCETGSLLTETRKSNSVPEACALFTLQGGYAPEKLKGMHKFIMKIVTKSLIKKIDGMENPKVSDLAMKNALQNGGSFVSEANLSSVLEFINN